MIRRIALGIGVTTFDKLVIAATQLALVPVLAHRWGLERYGLWLLLATVPQFLSMSDFGFATAAGTRMTMAAARGERDEVVRVFQSAWRAIVASSAAILLVLLAAVWLMPQAVLQELDGAPPGTVRATLTILVLYGVAAVQGSIFFAGFRAAGLFALGGFWNATVLLIENAALVLTVLAGGNLVAAALAWLIGRLLGLAGQNLLLRRRVPWLRIGWREGNWREARRLLAPAGAVMLLPLAQALVLQGTALVVGAVAGQAAVPVFAATRTLSRIGMQLCWIVSTPIMPELSAAAARGDRQRMAALTGATLLLSGLLVVPYALGFALFGQAAIGVWTHGAILPPQALVTLVAIGLLCGGLWYPVSNLILACNRHAGYTVRYVLLALASLPLSSLCVERFGVAGAGLAMAALDGAMLLVVVRQARGVLPGPRPILTAAAPVLSGLRMRLAKVARAQAQGTAHR